MTDGVMLARPVHGLVNESQRVSHLFPIPATQTPPHRITALCGASFGPGQLERLDHPSGMPCEHCLSRSPQETRDPSPPPARLDAIERTLHQMQIQINGIKTALAATIGELPDHDGAPRQENDDFP
ncbi:hypothetical protein GCM10009676_45390 [Prauserella halophila]|uniref:Uncharacterized protein n=1 Tax=Prauserella halophila TaxID=185641 RepID=A0ABP4H7W3_9PSEU|nr:hypothetical protein [Prauserella halophila]MCP2237602.1 hypothetical protein [Prauserella halophila]